MKVSKKSLGMIEISETMVKRDKARSAKLPRPEICFVNYMFIQTVATSTNDAIFINDGAYDWRES